MRQKSHVGEPPSCPEEGSPRAPGREAKGTPGRGHASRESPSEEALLAGRVAPGGDMRLGASPVMRIHVPSRKRPGQGGKPRCAGNGEWFEQSTYTFKRSCKQWGTRALPT